MKEILEKYKDRLVNLSGKNRSLAMKKLYKKRAFDIYNLKEFNENIYEDILKYVKDSEKEQCYILEDYSMFFANEKKVLDKLYDEKRADLKGKSKRMDNGEGNKELLYKKQKIEGNYQSELGKIERRRDKIISYGQSLKALSKEISDIEKETGKKELYLGYPFVEGNFKDGTFFKAPLMLYQISLKKEGDSWFINSNRDSKITINKVFLLAIEKYNEIKIEGIEEEYEDLSKKTIKELLDKISKFGIYFDVKFEGLEKINEYNAKSIPKYNFGVGKIIENIVIGQFPLSNSIYKDYEELIDGNLDNKLLKSLLKTETNEVAVFKLEEEHGKLSFSEKNLFFISQLDYSQELAVKRSGEFDKLVIYGPPGTGKSQTITNIIANSIANGKKVLMVSQKRAALDVIYNRLGELNTKAIIIHDINADKKKFYGAISSSLDIKISENDNFGNEINKQSKLIDEKILKLEKIAEILTRDYEIGLTLQEMYSKSKVIESKEDLRFDKFMRYRKFATKEGIDKINYYKLVDSVEKIDKNIIDAFLKYKELSDKNSQLKNINKSISRIEILEAISDLEIALEKELRIEEIKSKEKFVFDEFSKVIFREKKILSDNLIKSISKKINEHKNKEFMISNNSGQWWILKENNKEEYNKIHLFLESNNYSFTEEEIKKLSVQYNNEKNLKLKTKLNEGNWWRNIRGDNEIKDFIHVELMVNNFNFNESDLERKSIEIYNNNNRYLLEKITEKSWIKRLFNKSKNQRKEQEQEKKFYDGLEKHKKEYKRIALEISNKYFENNSKEKENLIKFKMEQENYNQLFLKLANEVLRVYYENIKKDKENENKLEESYKEIFTIIEKLNSLLEEKLLSLETTEKAFSKEKFQGLKDQTFKLKEIKKELDDLIEALNMLENYSEEITIVRELSVLQKKILINSILENGTIVKEDIKNIIEFSILQNILKVEKDDEVKEAIKCIDEFEKTIDFTNEKMKLKQELVKKYIINKCQKEIELLKYEKGYKEFKRQADKKKALWPIRQYMEFYNKEILSVFSCFLLGPETVSNVLPLINGLFDIVIFDEASQMFIEEAIPTIYRAKKAIIAGDDKQLKPSGTFKSTISSELNEDEEEIEDLAALEEESLLDLAKINYEKVHLTYHYRSQYEELISFSNYAFYDGRLKISPNKISANNNFKPIERIKCEGRWIERNNIEEAKEVVNLVYKTLLERKNDETIGIITFNISQKNVIEEMLELKAQKDSSFRELYIKELERIENSEDVSLFVKNIENVQGDERDIIIFSVGYGKNENGRVSVNFGALSQEGGENRLNVAISRAKKKIYLVTSIEPEELNVEGSKNRGPRLFKKYLQYVRAISSGNKEEAKIILNSLVDSDVVKNEARKHDSDFEAEVYDALVEHGFEVHTQIGVSGYKIDMAIYDREKDEYILGIECDGAAFHSSKSARERDIHRQRYLESRGWNIIRVWSRHWWKNPKGEIKKIQMKLEELKIGRAIEKEVL